MEFIAVKGRADAFGAIQTAVPALQPRGPTRHREPILAQTIEGTRPCKEKLL
jgi:hypothetical protein